MPDESQGFQEQGRPGEEAPQVCLMTDIMVVSSVGEGKITGRNILELDDFKQTDGVKQSAQSSDINILKRGLSESQVSVEVGVAKTAQAPEPLRADSLLKGTGVTPQATDHDSPVNSSSDRLQTDNSAPSRTDSCSSLPELDRSSFEKMNSISPVNLDTSHSDKNTKNSSDDDGDNSQTDLIVKPKAENSLTGSPPASPDVSSNVYQTRDSIDVRWEEEDEDEDRRSTGSRRTVKEGVCCCYQAFHRAFLQCVEETPAMLSGLVLSLAFCVAIIVLIPTTGRVRYGERECVCE